MSRGWFRESHRHSLAAKGIKTGRKNVQRRREKNGILDLSEFPEMWEKVVKEIGTGRRYPDAFETWYKQWLKSGGFEKADEIILRMKEEEEVKTLEEGERRLRKMLFVQWQLETKGIVSGRRKTFAERAKIMNNQELVDIYLAFGAGGLEPEFQAVLGEINKRGGIRKLMRGKTFARGSPQRAVRDVLARKLEDKPEIDDPWALATHMVKKGTKLGPGARKELVDELLEQYHMAGVKLTKKQAERIAEKWVARKGTGMPWG